MNTTLTLRRDSLSRARKASLLPLLVVAVLTFVGGAFATQGSSYGSTGAIAGRDYDLGIRTFPQPGLSGQLSKMPIRLWGTIAVPRGSGPFPVVLVAHGSHGDGCPGEFGTWPCFAREQRNDLGFRYLVRALAKAGFVAFAPDLNAAHTGGWGEVEKAEALRFGQVVDATFSELALANRGQKTRFGIPLQGKLDLSTLGVLGHSRGGMNVLEWGKGKTAVRSTFLLAPFFDPAKRVADVPATVALGTCDGDTGLQGAKYFAALRGKPRTEPAYQLTLQSANHNYYNQTLARLKANDAPSGRPGCGRGKQLAAGAQQAWLASVATDHFGVSLLEGAPASWMQAPPPQVVYGQRTAVRQLVP